MRSKYYQLLKSPGWKNFSQTFLMTHPECEVCRSRSEVAHHEIYEPDKLPENYRWHEISALCNACHRQLHSQLNELWIQCLAFDAPQLKRLTDFVFERRHQFAIESNIEIPITPFRSDDSPPSFKTLAEIIALYHLPEPVVNMISAALWTAFKTYEPFLFSHALLEFVSNRRLVENHSKTWNIQHDE
jgi:hypothetical protein